MKSFSELPDYPELRRLWKQEPVEAPRPDLELTPDHWVERGAEVIGWALARLEYWLSRSGWLRAWLRLNLFLAVVLVIAGFLLLPPVARVLEQLARSGHWLSLICQQVIDTITALPPAVISLGVLYLVFVFARRLYLRRRSRGRAPYDDERYYQ